MEIRMIKLIASDLDGTLLQNGAQELTPRAVSLVRKLTEKGIYFVAASGRQYANERRLFAPVRDDISYIAENGSVCIHKGKVISRGSSKMIWHSGSSERSNSRQISKLSSPGRIPA